MVEEGRSSSFIVGLFFLRSESEESLRFPASSSVHLKEEQEEKKGTPGLILLKESCATLLLKGAGGAARFFYSLQGVNKKELR